MRERFRLSSFFNGALRSMSGNVRRSFPLIYGRIECDKHTLQNKQLSEVWKLSLFFVPVASLAGCAIIRENALRDANGAVLYAAPSFCQLVDLVTTLVLKVLLDRLHLCTIFRDAY